MTAPAGPEVEPELRERTRALLVEIGLVAPGEAVAVRRLTGGVASDIVRAEAAGGRWCAKFALDRLRVAEEWRAPTRRNRAEYAWLAFAGRVAPESAPRLFGEAPALGGFAMELIEEPGAYLLKAALLDGRSRGEEAPAVGAALARIHAAAAAPGFDRRPFRNRDDFRALRLDPYLGFAAGRHPDVAPRLLALAEACDRAEVTLVHGDVSPKNVILRGGAPVLLDAECATMGDPAFDAAFFLNHLVLKAAHLPAARSALLAAAGRFWSAYAAGATWEGPQGLEARVAALLPALMLARIDGKSPVEYLGGRDRARIRALALDLLRRPEADLAPLLARIAGWRDG